MRVRSVVRGTFSLLIALPCRRAVRSAAAALFTPSCESKRMRAFALSLVAVAAVAAVPSLHAQGPLAEPPVERAAAPALPADAMMAPADAPVAVTVRRKAAHTGV